MNEPLSEEDQNILKRAVDGTISVFVTFGINALEKRGLLRRSAAPLAEGKASFDLTDRGRFHLAVLEGRIVPLSSDGMRRATTRANKEKDRVVARVMRAVTDQQRKERLADLKCSWCFYLAPPRIVGHRFTEWTCKHCGAVGMHSNTCTPSLCAECATKMNLCVVCTADLDLTSRRLLSIERARRSR